MGVTKLRISEKTPTLPQEINPHATPLAPWHLGDQEPWKASQVEALEKPREGGFGVTMHAGVITTLLV